MRPSRHSHRPQGLIATIHAIYHTLGPRRFWAELIIIPPCLILFPYLTALLLVAFGA